MNFVAKDTDFLKYLIILRNNSVWGYRYADITWKSPI